MLATYDGTRAEITHELAENAIAEPWRWRFQTDPDVRRVLRMEPKKRKSSLASVMLGGGCGLRPILPHRSRTHRGTHADLSERRADCRLLPSTRQDERDERG